MGSSYAASVTKNDPTPTPSTSSAGSGSSGSAERALDFQVEDVDAEYERIAALGATLVMPPTTQPWGSRAMILADPDGNLVNLFSRSPA